MSSGAEFTDSLWNAFTGFLLWAGAVRSIWVAEQANRHAFLLTQQVASSIGVASELQQQVDDLEGSLVEIDERLAVEEVCSPQHASSRPFCCRDPRAVQCPSQANEAAQQTVISAALSSASVGGDNDLALCVVPFSDVRLMRRLGGGASGCAPPRPPPPPPPTGPPPGGLRPPLPPT